MTNKKDKCCICEEPCTGKLMIEARKGKLYKFCEYHFVKYEFFTLKQIREKIKKARTGCY